MKRVNSNATRKNKYQSESLDNSAGRVVSRRSFLATTGLASLAMPLIVPRHVLGGPGYQPPSDTLRIAAVGLGMGFAYLNGCKSEQVIALCDLDHNLPVAAKAFKTFPKARRYHDYRKMLDKEAKNIDALIIATPDHTHTIILMAAIELGKHIYCAKPITHNIGEARRVRQTLSENKHLVTKSSVQASGTDSARNTTELLNSGTIGLVREVHIWCDHPANPTSLLRPTDTQTPPPGMDWDLWIGPAPYRPFHSAYHPWIWRAWWDFGSGSVGDMTCHTLHTYFRELQLGAPTLVYGYGSVRNDGIFKRVPTPECQSTANMITWEFPERGSLPPLNVHWYDGGLKPHRPAELDHSLDLPRMGIIFVGDKSKLITGYGGGNPFKIRNNKPRGGLLLPEDKFRDFQEPPKTMRRVDDHYGEWTQACKTGARTVCSVEFGCEMTEMGLLGALALRTNQVLEWDAKTMQVTNRGDEVNSLVDPPYRSGWEL